MNGGMAAGMMNIYAPQPQADPVTARIVVLPPRNRAFTGRVEILEKIDKQVRRGEVVPMQGLSGIGKTQLALEYVHQHADEYSVVWWVDAETPSLAAAGLIALAGRLGVATGTGSEAVPPGLWSALTERGEWLLVYDNVDDLTVLSQLMPSVPGRVLVTGRSAIVGRVGTRIEITEFSRDESKALLRKRCPRLSDADAGRVARQLGDLPLAVEQAGCFLAETSMDPSGYLEALVYQPAMAGLSDPTLDRHPGLAAAFAAGYARLQSASPPAARLLDQLAFLAPEPLPLRSAAYPAGVRAGGALQAATIIRDLTSLGLARPAGGAIMVHRLVQALTRARIPDHQHPAVLQAAAQLLATASPGDPADPASWPAYALLTPHIQAASQYQTDARQHIPEPKLRALMIATAAYLHSAGQNQAGADLAASAKRRWTTTIGPNDRDTLAAAAIQARALRDLGDLAEARDTGQDTLDRRRRMLGAAHPDTLASANEMAFLLYRLGEYHQARDLARQSLTQRDALGPDHPAILGAASRLAAALTGLAQHQDAHDLLVDTLDRRRRILGQDHPDTLRTANNLANILANLGDHQAAKKLDNDTLDRRCRMLGPWSCSAGIRPASSAASSPAGCGPAGCTRTRGSCPSWTSARLGAETSWSSPRCTRQAWRTSTRL